MKFTPHDYQKTTIDFLNTHDRGLIILDMGLGKTVSSLTAIKDAMFPKDGSEPRYKRPLIIAPKIVSENTWAQELAKWDHLSNLKYIELDAKTPKLRRGQFDRVDDYTLTILSESKIQWLIDELNAVDGPEWPWDAVFIDEISLFKSPKSKRFKNLEKKLRNRVKFCYGLTGTPAPNDLADLWAIMMLIDGGARLGKTKAQFNKRYCNAKTIKINNGEQEISMYKVAEEFYADILEAIEDVSLAMRASDHLDDAPAITTHVHEIDLPPKTVALMDDLTVKRVLELSEHDKSRREIRLERRIHRLKEKGTIKEQRKIATLEQELMTERAGSEIVLRASHIFSLINLQRQIANGAFYEAVPEHLEEPAEIAEFLRDRKYIVDNEAKIRRVRRIVRRAKDNVLIFYHYRHEAERLTKLFKGAEVLNTANAQKVLPRWNNKEIPVLLANPQSTKFGLNMQQGGHTIIWLGLDYSFEKYVQSNARLARQGQKKDAVDVHIIAAKDTIDTDIIKAIITKSEINDGVYSALGTENGVRDEIKNAAENRVFSLLQNKTVR